MNASPQPEAAPPLLGPLWIALHLAVALAALDLLTNLYHPQPHLGVLRSVLPSAAVAAAAGAALSLLILTPVWMAGRGTGASRAAAAEALGAVLGLLLAVTQWFEATPYHYNELMKLLTFGNLTLAALGHASLALRLRFVAHYRKSLIGATALTYTGGMLNLAGWFYITRVEEALGYEASQRVELGLGIFGSLTFAAGLFLLGQLAARALGGSPRAGAAARLSLVTFPYALLTAAVLLWRRDYGAGLPGEVSALIWTAPLILFSALAAAVVWRGIRALRPPVLLFLAIVAAGLILGYRDPLLTAARIRRYESRHEGVRKIVMISSDALRADVLGPYGGNEIRTPRLDEFARDAVVFDEAISSGPWTMPGVVGFLTGLSPGVFGPWRLGSRLAEAADTLAERLAEAGFYTGAVGMNALLVPSHGFNQGFRTYNFFPRAGAGRTLGTRLIRWADPGFFDRSATTEQLADLGEQWLSRNRSKDFFLWLHIYDPHGPLGPPPPFRPSGEAPEGFHEPWSHGMDVIHGVTREKPGEQAWIRQLYLQEVRYMDHHFGEVIDRLKNLGIYDEALVIFVSDHGEELWDRTMYGHGQTLFKELIRVPLMIKLPGKPTVGQVSRPVGTLSLPPTILDFAGVPYDPGAFSAPSIRPLCLDPRAELETLPLFSEGSDEILMPHRLGVRFGQYMAMQGPAVDSPMEVYDLEADPLQKNDLGKSQAGLLDQTRALLQEHHDRNAALRRLNGIGADAATELSPEEIDELRKLGYVQ